MSRRLSPDLLAVLGLTALWLLFFWRLFTPISADQVSLKQGDFSGQFVAFGGYQYARFADGEIPLWNPYNNGGLPFIADTQAAVFYPPRLATIMLARLSGGWSYHALELEMTAHVLAYSLMMYALVRRLTLKACGSVIGAFTAGLIAGYSGFTQGYAPLQLALLEAAIWLPLALIGIHEATRQRFRPSWLLLTGFALGLSWLAGHPQTSFFITYTLLAYFGYRIYARRLRWTGFVIGAAIFGLIAFGLAAVQLIPGVEYLTLTTRAGFGFDSKANGFPFQDVIQFIFPRIVSLYSPLFVGFMGLTLALVAVYRKLSTALFWGVIAFIALLWSFGGSSPIFAVLYNVLPGLYFFRGQERAAVLVMNSLAILAGLGAAHLLEWDFVRDYAAALRLRLWLNRVFSAVLLIGALVAVSWIGNPTAYGGVIAPLAFSIIIVGITSLALPYLLGTERPPRAFWILPAILVLELFTVSMGAISTYDRVPPEQQISIVPPPLIAHTLADTDKPFRVDGERGVLANYGSLYGLQDIRGISPLFLNRAWNILESDLRHQVAWELFAVRYVFIDWNELMIPSTIVGRGADIFGEINLHRLSDPRPFALVTYRQFIARDDTHALELLHDPSINPRQTVILDRDPGVLSVDRPSTPAQVTLFEPERVVIEADIALDGVLSVALVDYPGWHATIDGNTVNIIRAYGAMSAVPLTAGEHTVEFVYDPLSYRIGAVISIAAWLSISIASLGLYAVSKRTSTLGR